MSEKIKVTIVIDDEKQNREIDGSLGKNRILTHDTSMTLMSTLLQNNLMEGSFCGGRGDCGRCMVQFIQGAPLPIPLERGRLEAEELRKGYRLSCLTKPKNDCVIKFMFPKEKEIAIVTEMIELSSDIDCIGHPTEYTEKRKWDVIQSDGGSNLGERIGDEKAAVINTGIMIETNTDSDQVSRDSHIVAVDLGTTTIAMQLRNMDTGETVDTYCGMNPQRKFGADVLSRIQASCDGYREELRQCVWEVLERGVGQFIRAAGAETIACICIAGNTAMGHLLMGYDVSSLGKSPFIPVEIGLQRCEGPFGIPLYITPGISAFVGGDIVAGLYVLGMLCVPKGKQDARKCVTGQAKKVRLLIDLGTNGEMAITDGSSLMVTATAAGPAFEGGTEKAVVGTDMIAVAASLKRKGILDATGLLADPYFNEGIHVRTPQGEFFLRNQDIRALQMAKAAVRAGAEILWEKMGRPEIEKVYLAGGFGYYLDVEAAFAIGLLPEHMRGSVQAVGNTSLEGAFRIGRDLYRQTMDIRLLEAGLSSVRSMNLAQQAEFEDLYLQHMDLGRD